MADQGTLTFYINFFWILVKLTQKILIFELNYNNLLQLFLTIKTAKSNPSES